MKRRGNFCGTLEKKGKKGVYLARWTWNGRRFSRSTGCTDYDQALVALDKFTKPFRNETEIETICELKSKVEAISEHQKVEAQKGDGIRLDDLFGLFVQSDKKREVKPRTLENYQIYFRKFLVWVHNRHKYLERMKHVDDVIAKEFATELKDESSQNYVHDCLVFLRYLWNLFLVEGCCKSNPWVAVANQAKSTNKSHRDVFSEEDISRIFAKLTELGLDDLKDLYTVSLYTALRKIDCCRLKWDNVDFRKKLIKVIPIKTERYITDPIEIPLHDVLFRVLFDRRTHQERGETHVFPMWCEGNPGRFGFNKKFAAILDGLGIERCRRDGKGRLVSVHSAHSWRHTAISWLVESGISPLIVAKLAGHRRIAQTSHYTKSFMQSMQTKINASIPDFTRQKDCGIADNAELSEIFDPVLDGSKEDTLKRLMDFWREGHKSA